MRKENTKNEIVLTYLVKGTVFLWLTLFYFKMRRTNFDPFWFHNSVKLQATDHRNQMNNKVAWLLKTFKYSALHSWADWLKLNRWERVIDSVELLLKRSRPSLKKDHDLREELLFLFNTDKENMSEQKLQREPLKSTGNILGSQAQQIRTKVESMPSETKVRWFVRILKWCALMVNYGIQCSNVL